MSAVTDRIHTLTALVTAAERRGFTLSSAQATDSEVSIHLDGPDRMRAPELVAALGIAVGEVETIPDIPESTFAIWHGMWGHTPVEIYGAIAAAVRSTP